MKSVHVVQRELLERIRTEGVQAAYEASLAVAKDPAAPAPARATASATLFRVAGYFDRRDSSQEKAPHEMTPDELSEALARMQARAERLSGVTADDDSGEDEGGIFG